METCPTCGLQLAQPTGRGAAFCRHCTLAQIMDDSDATAGSSNADDYEIEREIGRGGDGSVYLAFDKKVGREVAIKLISSLHSSDKLTERRFRAEIDAIASLDHPNIIPIYANGEMDRRPFFTMKYVRGGSLATQMEKFSTPTAVVELMIKLTHAIQHAHERGVLHRDLKPSNILLDEEGEPYISDFGLAKRHDQSLELTTTGSVMGTPAYMSPEQARGDNTQVTTTSDVFSLGSIFFELLTGRQSFEGTTSHSILRNVIENEVQFTRQDRQKINRDLATVCLKCLEKSPERRYSSASAFAADLERWERGDPVEARRISTVERCLRWVYRHPIPVGASMLALLSLIVGFIVSISQWHQAESARQLSDLERHAADDARAIAEENAYYSSISNALAARERFDFGETHRLLRNAPPDRRGFEWNLINGLSRGDQDWITDLGESPPLHLVQDRATSRVILLTTDRQLHEVNPTTGEHTRIGKFPKTPGGSPTNVHHPGLTHFSFAPDGKHYSLIDGNQLMIVATASNEIVYQSKCHSGGSTIWLSSTRLLHAMNSTYSIKEASPGVYRGTGWTYDLAIRKKKSLPTHHHWAGPFALSPDGTRIALVHKKWSAIVYRTDQDFQGDPEFHFRSTHGYIKQLAFSPDGQHLAIGALNSTSIFGIQIQDLVSRKVIFEQNWPSKALMAFSPETSTFTITGREPYFTTWRYLLPRSEEMIFDDGHANPTPYRKNGPFLPPSQLLTRATSDHRTTFFCGHKAPVSALLHLPSGKAFLTASHDGTLRRWSLTPSHLKKNRRVNLITKHGSLHPSSSHNGDYCIYMNKKGFHPEVWHRPSSSSFSFPRGQFHLAVLNDGRALTRVAKTGELICWQVTLNAPPEELWRIEIAPAYKTFPHTMHSAITPDERYASILHPGSILTMDFESRTAVEAHGQVRVPGSLPGQSTAISPDGKLVITTGFKGPCARVYERASPTAGHEKVIPAISYTTKDSACAFSHDGSRLYIGNNDGKVRVFETSSLKELPAESWQAHSAEITAIAISQRGDIIATAGGESTILWSTKKHPDKTRRQRLRLNTGSSSRNWIQFCADDTLLYHSGHLHPIEVWEAGR